MKRLHRKDVREHLRIGKSIKCGTKWYTIERFSKTHEAMLITTSPWEVEKGKQLESQIITFDEVLNNVNEGDWIVKIRGSQRGTGSTENNMTISEMILKNVKDAKFTYPMKQIPSDYGEDTRKIARKVYDLFTDSSTSELFDVGLGYIKPTLMRKYARSMKNILRKKDGSEVPAETADGVVALQIGNGAGPLVMILNDGSIFVEKFMRDGTSKGFVRFDDFNKAKPHIIRTKTNLIAWAKNTEESITERSFRARKKAVSERISKETVMAINNEIRKAIVTEDVMRTRFHNMMMETDTSDIENNTPNTTADDIDDSDDREKYKEDILATAPRNLSYEQKETLAEDPDLYAEYEANWGIIPLN